MKRFVLLIALAGAVAFTALTPQRSEAQIVNLTGSSYGNVLDTVTNTGTYYLTTPYLSAQNSGKYVIQLNAVNKTGTTTITAVLQSSLDNVGWSNHFKTPGQTGVNCDTLAISGTTYHSWNILQGAQTTYAGGQYSSNSGRRLYFRIKLVGGATGTTQVRAYELPQ